MKTVDTPEILKLPIGINAAGTRRETDSMGEIEVPADRYWGAQTQRSLVHFSIGNDHMPAGVLSRVRLCQKSRRGRQRRRGPAAALESRTDLPGVRRSDLFVLPVCPMRQMPALH